MRALVGEMKIVGAPTIQVELEVGNGVAREEREIPCFARNDEGHFAGAKNVGVPTFKVTLEVRLEVTDSQIGIAPEVIT